jgi:glucokinase
MYIGVDVGGTKIRIASFKSLDSPQISKVTEFATSNNYETDISKLIQQIEDLIRSKIDGIAVAVAGVFNRDKTILKYSPNINSWQNHAVADDLKKVFNCRVVTDNDAVAGALGEAIFGNGKYHDFLFVTWGSGIGSTKVGIINNEIKLTPFEIGHQNIIPNGAMCNCGRHGCLEAYCGGKAIEKLYGTRPQDLSKENWDQVGEHFVSGINNALKINPVELIIFSGGIALSQEKRLKAIITTPKIMFSEFRQDSGVVGALALLGRR